MNSNNIHKESAFSSVFVKTSAGNSHKFLHHSDRIIVVVKIVLCCKSKLFHVCKTMNGSGFVERRCQCGKQNPGKDGYDDHYDEEFYKCKMTWSFTLQV